MGGLYREIRQLEYLQAIASSKNLTRSAQHLHVSQPTITVAIQKLEQELEIALFDRSQKQFELTFEGKIFLNRVNDILNRLDDSIAELHNYRALQKGSIRIGVPPHDGSLSIPLYLIIL